MSLRPQCCSILLVAAALAGCAGHRQFLDRLSNVPPTEYKSDIIAYLRAYLNDPTNVRNAALTEPALQRVEGGERYVACVRFNARNSNGQYAGVQDTMAIFKAGKLDRFIELPSDPNNPDTEKRAYLREFCQKATYQPFPEIEHLTR